MKIWIHTPDWLIKLFPQVVWKFNTNKKIIFLTFDDGPTPGVTPRVLDFLCQAGMKATFFCLGENIQKYPDLAKRIVLEGHKIANHGFLHLNGLTVDSELYIDNMKRGAIISQSTLFRPPYGKIWPWQISKIKKLGNTVVLWNIMSMDFDCSIKPSECLNNITSHLSKGAIIVFHDTIKASPNLITILPDFLAYLSENGFESDVIH